MANRRPLVVATGRKREIADGDTLLVPQLLSKGALSAVFCEDRSDSTKTYGFYGDADEGRLWASSIGDLFRFGRTNGFTFEIGKNSTAPAGSLVQVAAPLGVPGIVAVNGTAGTRCDIRFQNGAMTLGASASASAPTALLGLSPTDVSFAGVSLARDNAVVHNAGNESGITGAKTWTGLQTNQHTSGTALVLERTNSTVNSTVEYKVNNGSVFAGGQNNGAWSVGPNVNLSTTPWLQVTASRIGPGVDNAASAGLSSLRYSVVYAATGTINTSDERQKTPLRALNAAEVAAALEIADTIGIFQMLNAVAEKGDAARLHTGVGAQTCDRIMRARGLDPTRYAWFCYDAWPEQQEQWHEWPAEPAVYETWDAEIIEHPADFNSDGVLVPAWTETVREAGQRLVREAVEGGRELIQEYRAAGSLYGVRYDQLAMWILAAMRAQQRSASARMTAIEDRLAKGRA